MTFDPKSLRQWWPKPSNPCPIVVFGAGSIVGDAHLPAYKQGGFPVAGLYDPNAEKAAALAAQSLPLKKAWTLYVWHLRYHRS